MPVLYSERNQVAFVLFLREVRAASDRLASDGLLQHFESGQIVMLVTVSISKTQRLHTCVKPAVFHVSSQR